LGVAAASVIAAAISGALDWRAAAGIIFSAVPFLAGVLGDVRKKGENQGGEAMNPRILELLMKLGPVLVSTLGDHGVPPEKAKPAVDSAIISAAEQHERDQDGQLSELRRDVDALKRELAEKGLLARNK